MKIVFILFLFIVTQQKLVAAEACSRVAIINFQEILVDTNSTQKGEGLRYHLEKDKIATEYLEVYQKGTDIKWQNSLLGSLGTGLILSSFFVNSSSDDKKPLLITGITMVAINFLVAKTLLFENEKNLINAIDEYNKRNLPKIYFSPDYNKSDGKQDVEFGVNKTWSY